MFHRLKLVECGRRTLSYEIASGLLFRGRLETNNAA